MDCNEVVVCKVQTRSPIPLIASAFPSKKKQSTYELQRFIVDHMKLCFRMLASNPIYFQAACPLGLSDFSYRIVHGSIHIAYTCNLWTLRKFSLDVWSMSDCCRLILRLHCAPNVVSSVEEWLGHLLRREYLEFVDTVLTSLFKQYLSRR